MNQKITYSLDKRLNNNQLRKNNTLKVANFIKANYTSKEDIELVDHLCMCGTNLVYTEIEAAEKLNLSSGMFCQKHLLCELCAERRTEKYLPVFTERYKEVESDLATSIPY